MKAVGENGWLRPGARLIGKYEIVRLIGRGGFGLVYEALHLGLRARVAVKVLRAEGRQHPQTLERFRREAWASAQIASPHVVRVMDVDVLEDGSPFIVMELLRGRDLEQEIVLRGRLPIAETVGYVLQTASAIAEAHARGVVHRDLKPNNLFLAEQGGARVIKVLDFGLSKIASALSVTKTSSQLGTPLYMSPEQIRSAKGTDTRSDVWALGVILYRMFSLRTPFEGETATDVMVAIVSQPAPELAELVPSLPAPLARAVMKALRKDPAERFRTVAELAAALAPFGPAGAFIDAAAVAMRSPELGPSATLTDSSHDAPEKAKPSRSRAAVTAAAAALGVVLLGLGLRTWWISSAQQAAAASSPDAPVAAAPAVPAPPVVVALPPAVVTAPPVVVPSASAALQSPSAPVPTAAPRSAAPRHVTVAAPAAPDAPVSPAAKRDLGF